MACRLDGAKPLSEPMMEYRNWTLRNKFQWNSNRNSYIFIQENALENVVCEVAFILSRPQCVKLHTLFCGALFSCGYIAYSLWIHEIYESIFFSVVSPALWQSSAPMKKPWKIWIKLKVANHIKTQPSANCVQISCYSKSSCDEWVVALYTFETTVDRTHLSIVLTFCCRDVWTLLIFNAWNLFCKI